jgi:tetratricopeptide (TPR) repeat protein
MCKNMKSSLVILFSALFLMVWALPMTAQESLFSYIGSGIGYYNQGDYTAALAKFDDALADYPTDSYSHNWRGFIHYLLGNMDAAWADMNKAIELGEEFAWVDRAMLYTRTGDDVLAVINYERGMRHYEQYAYPSAFPAHGSAFEFFVETYTPIIEAYPDDFIALTVRGNAYAHLGEYEKALADYARVLELAPQFARVRHSQAMAQLTFDLTLEFR